MKAWSWKNGLEFGYKSGCGEVTYLLGFYIKKKEKRFGVVSFGGLRFMFVRGCSVECWLWDSHLGFHWDFGVVVCGVCFAFWLSVGGFARLLWCWVLYSKKRKKIRGCFIRFVEIMCCRVR